MKTLVNKNNPAIRITAPDEMVKNRTNCWAIWSEGDRLMLLDKDNWTLVEEEPKHTEVWVEGRTIFEQDAKKPEVDLEKAAEEYAFGNLDDAALYGCTMSGRIAAFKAGAEWQKKQKFEWSEEDEAMRDDILRVLSYFVGTVECDSNPSVSTSYLVFQREMNWLKSLKPQPKQDWIKEQTKKQ